VKSKLNICSLESYHNFCSILAGLEISVLLQHYIYTLFHVIYGLIWRVHYIYTLFPVIDGLIWRVRVYFGWYLRST